MTMLRAGMLNFSKGVLSEKLQGRVDVNAYNAGLKRGENIVVLKQGAFTMRPGFQLVTECLSPDEWLVPFQFSDEQAYALVFGQEYMQPLTAGGNVLEEELVIVGITNENPMIVEAANHAYEPGDQVYFNQLDGDLGAVLNGRVWSVIASGDDDDDHFAIDVDGTAFPAFSGATGGITRADPPPPPPPPPDPPPPPYVPPVQPPVYGGGGGGGGRYNPDEKIP